jgi:soluble cytochrome b562
MFEDLFTKQPIQSKPLKKSANLFDGLFDKKENISETKTTKQKTAGLPNYLGGGSYNLGDNGGLITTERDYAGVKAEGQYREHIFPVALGGTSSFDNIKVYGKDLGTKKSAYENEIIRQYKSGKIGLGEARGLVLKKYRELTGLDPKQGVLANLPDAIAETVTNPIKKVGGFFKNLFKEEKQMEFRVGDNLNNTTDVLPGPRKSTLEAIERGEDINIITTPIKTSQKGIAKETLLKSTTIAEREEQQGLYKEAPVKITPKDLARVTGEKQKGQLSETSQFINETVRKSNLDAAMGATEPLKSVADKAVAKTIANIAKSKTETNIVRNLTKLPTPIVKAAQSIYPIKQQNATVKSIFKDWTRGLLTGEEKANQYVNKFKKTGATVDDLLKYEKGEASKLPKEIKQEFDALRQKAQDLGLKVNYRENYIPQVYDNTAEEVKTAVSKFMEDNGVEKEVLEKYIAGIGELPEEISKRLKLNPSFIKARALPDYATAIKYGLTPKYTEPAQLLAYYDAQLSKTTANNKLIDELIAKKQIATVEGAGENWEALSLPFSPKGYYAEPELAQMLNGMFRNEEALGFSQSATKFVAKTSKLMQEINLSAGVPFTGINFFSTGIGLVKNLTAGEFKSVAAFVRSNFNEATIKYFAKNSDYLTKMANQGIDISNRAGNYKNIYKSFSNTKGIGAKLGLTWDKMFQEKTFNNLLPMNQLDTFKGVYNKAIKKGIESGKAEQLAGDTVKAFYGLMENVGRGKGTEDALSAVFFAPKFREGIINTLINTGKSVTTEIFNPAFRKNRNLLAGMILTYAGYNALNKKLTGHYMWDNPDGKEFDLMIPTKFGNNQDDVIYTSFMPSFLSFARNMGSGAIAIAKGDTATAKQKFGSVFSMPIKLASELWANKDYFGREIYNENDSRATKLKKMAQYTGLQINHPFIRETYRQITTDKPLYQSMSEALELPVKFSSYTKIEKQQFYEAIEKQKIKTAQEKTKFKPTYDNINSLIEQGNIDEAQNLLDNLSDEDYKKYKSFANSDKQRANINEELKIYDRFNEIQQLISSNDTETAQEIVDGFTDEEYAAYVRLKNKIK